MHLALSMALVVLVQSITLGDYNKDEWAQYYSEQFSCYEDCTGGYNQANGNCNTPVWKCCGLMANGQRQCADASEWVNVGGSADGSLKTNRFSLCVTNVNNIYNAQTGVTKDLCCQNNYFSDCGVCRGFVVWEFDTFEEMDQSSKTTFDENWKTTYLAQNEDDTNAYDNAVYPGGFIHATLREYNDPPVCVYMPSAGGHIIEIKVEPDEEGNTVCVNDLHDDQQERDNPGQITTCDDTRLRTCFSDGEMGVDDEVPGFAFYIDCEQGCADGDIHLWLRARASAIKWSDVVMENAEENTEMWCQWMDKDDPRYDTYPSEIRPARVAISQPMEDSVASLSSLFALLLTAIFLV